METNKSAVLSHYATREDFQGVRIELQSVKGEISNLRLEMQAFEANMRGEMHQLRADLFTALIAQTWKMVGFVLSVNIATVTAVYYIAN